MSKNGINLKYCIAINYKSQGSIAKHLRCDELFTTHLSKLQAKWLIVSCAPFALQFVLKDAEIAR